MPTFTILFRRADHADASSRPLEATDIDDAAAQAVELCEIDEYVAGVWQRDTPAAVVAWHAWQPELAELGRPAHERLLRDVAELCDSFAYFTCESCGHVETRQAAVEPASQCESCGYLHLSKWNELDCAEERSEVVMQIRGGRRS